MFIYHCFPVKHLTKSIFRVKVVYLFTPASLRKKKKGREKDGGKKAMSSHIFHQEPHLETPRRSMFDLTRNRIEIAITVSLTCWNFSGTNIKGPQHNFLFLHSIFLPRNSVLLKSGLEGGTLECSTC